MQVTKSVIIVKVWGGEGVIYGVVSKTTDGTLKDVNRKYHVGST